MKTNKYEEFAKYIIASVLALLVILVGAFFLNLYIKLTKIGYTGCIESGYTSAYCIKHS